MSIQKTGNNPVARKEAFFENRVGTLQARVKELEYDCAELEKANSELSERVKKLANRQPAWPKGYRPQRRHHAHRD
jgi:predicted nuclease with TOPRIM domain